MPEPTARSHEVACIVDCDGNVLLWKNGRTAAVDDDAEFWHMLWENKHRIKIVAHTHPGRGIPIPSHEDVTTFAAVEAALGRRLEWWIVSADSVTKHTWFGNGEMSYEDINIEMDTPPTWVDELRRRSGQQP